MVTRLLVIQKINADGTAQVYQVHSDFVSWSFETGRMRSDADTEFFPFYLRTPCNINRSLPGGETRIVATENEISFSDDYGIPAGTVIGILFPKGFIPCDFIFKDKPYIPPGLPGQVSLIPPGQIEIISNNLEKSCAIVFHIHQNTCFGFSCASKKVINVDFAKEIEMLQVAIINRNAAPEIWLDSQDVMKILKINDRQLMRRRQKGVIPFSGTRGNYLYRESDIQALLTIK